MFWGRTVCSQNHPAWLREPQAGLLALLGVSGVLGRRVPCLKPPASSSLALQDLAATA